MTEHKSFGAGVYHFFRDYPVTVESAIVAPKHLESSFHFPLSAYLDGKGRVNHVLNHLGKNTTESHRVEYVCENIPVFINNCCAGLNEDVYNPNVCPKDSRPIECCEELELSYVPDYDNYICKAAVKNDVQININQSYPVWFKHQWMSCLSLTTFALLFIGSLTLIISYRYKGYSFSVMHEATIDHNKPLLTVA